MSTQTDDTAEGIQGLLGNLYTMVKNTVVAGIEDGLAESDGILKRKPITVNIETKFHKKDKSTDMSNDTAETTEATDISDEHGIHEQDGPQTPAPKAKRQPRKPSAKKAAAKPAEGDDGTDGDAEIVAPNKPAGTKKRKPEEVAADSAIILGYLKDHPWSSAESIGKATGIDKESLKLPLIRLRESGKVITDGVKKQTTYALAGEQSEGPTKAKLRQAAEDAAAAE